jgi:hypothetical protein
VSYYDRKTARHVDGTPIFSTPEDDRNQEKVARFLEKAWGCEVKNFGKLAPVDWWFQRDGRLVGVGELKCCTVKNPDNHFLNLRKWLALNMAANGVGVPAVFVVMLMDERVFSIKVNKIDASRIIIGGCSKIVKSRNDVEPVILVPALSMKEVKLSDANNPVPGN